MSTVYCSNMSLLDCDSDANLIEASLPQHPTDLVLIIQFVYAIYCTGYAGCRGYMIFCVHSLGSKTKQAQLGVPHSRKQIELGFILQAGTCLILNFAQNPRQSQSVYREGGTTHIFSEQGANRGEDTAHTL